MRWVSALKLRTVMSSIMRRRSGLMVSSLIGELPSRGGLGHPSILETGRLPRHQSVQPITAATRRARHLAYNVSREAGSFRVTKADILVDADMFLFTIWWHFTGQQKPSPSVPGYRA